MTTKADGDAGRMRTAALGIPSPGPIATLPGEVEEVDMADRVPLVVSTDHRGVFFGYGAYKPGVTEIELTRCRMCVYWSAATRGFNNLAVIGPQKGSLITGAVPRMYIRHVESIMKATPEAVLAWETVEW